jgi:nitrous oxidase accessory protein
MNAARALAVACALAATVALPATSVSAQGEATQAPMDHDAHQVADDGTVTMPASHLQRMIDHAPSGAVVAVPAGTYVGAIVIDRPLSLAANGDAVIDGNLEGAVITITAPDVAIEGVTVRRSGTGPIGSPSGILLEGADRARIHDVEIVESYIGITVRLSSSVVIDGVTIRGRGEITDELHAVDDEPAADEHAAHGQGPAPAPTPIRGDGIWLWNADRAVVRDTTIEDVRDGVYVSYGVGALVERTRITGSRYAIHDMYAEDLSIIDATFERNLSGAVLMYGGPVTVRGTTIVESGSASTGFGVLVKDVGDVTITGNVLADNRVGLQIDDAGRTGGSPTTVTGNTVALNQIGLLLMPSADAVVGRNGFVENSTQVTIGGDGTTQVTWHVDGAGNHWSDYAGYDADGDGRGDVPYVHSGRTSELLASQPLLLALASGPGFRVFTRISDEWSPSTPLVHDDAPLIDAVGPAMRDVAAGPSVPLGAAGLLLVVLCGLALVRARRSAAGGTR